MKFSRVRSFEIVLWTVAFFGRSLFAKSLLAPVAPYTLYQAALGPALDFENDPVQLHTGIGTAENGNSGAAFAFSSSMFSTVPKENPRKGGWSLGGAVGTNSYDEIPKKIVTPAQYYWELHLGRGTLNNLITGNSGLRGYIEVAFRDTRPYHYSEQDQFFAKVQRTQSEHLRHVAIRMGAAKDFGKEGLVLQQSPSSYFWSLESSFYIPLQSPQAMLSLKPTFLFRCGFDSLSCGLGALYLYQSHAESSDKLEDMKHMVWLGPELRGVYRNNFSVRLNAQWTYARGRNAILWGRYPRSNLELAVGF